MTKNENQMRITINILFTSGTDKNCLSLEKNTKFTIHLRNQANEKVYNVHPILEEKERYILL